MPAATITALCAMQHFTQNEAVTRTYLASKVQQIITRSGITKAGVRWPTAGALSDRRRRRPGPLLVRVFLRTLAQTR